MNATRKAIEESEAIEYNDDCYEIHALLAATKFRMALKLAVDALDKLRSVNSGKHYIPGVIEALDKIEAIFTEKIK